MKKIEGLLLSSGILFSLFAGAQNEVDVLRYSRTTFGGTARNSSMAGAFGALGGDFGALSSNPAGIGIYRKSELTFTPSIFTQSTTSTYNNETASDNKFNFNIGNIGLVASYNKPEGKEQSGWLSANFAFGYNRTNNFHNRISIQGTNTENSLLDVFVQNADGRYYTTLDPLEYMAFYTYLIDTLDGYPYYYDSKIPSGSNIKQRKSIETKGSMGETFFSFGGNYNNKLYVGASLGFPNIRYTEESTYEEIDENNTVPVFNSYSYGSSLTTRALGVNLKIGAIYSVSDWVRLGGAIHSPTFFSVTDEFSNTMKSNLWDTTYETSDGPYTIDYHITTPMRAIGSLAFIIAKKGVLSADYEFIDYAEGKLRSSQRYFDENNIIRNTYVATSNVRLGAEWRLDPFSIRGGYALYGGPYSKSLNGETSRSSFTAGVGYRENGYFVDFAYVLSVSSDDYYLYDPSMVNPAKNDFQSSALMVTLGFRY